MIFDVVTYFEGRKTVDTVTGSRRRALDRFADLNRPDVRGDPVVTVIDHRGDPVAIGE